jgi:hypothetical protein
MKFHLAIFSALSIGLYLVWLGYNYAKALGSAFGNLDPALGPDHVGFVLVLVGVLSAACIIAAIFTPYDVGRILALLPIALVVVGEGYFVHTERGRLTEHARIQDARQSIREDRIEQISKDYVLICFDLSTGFDRPPIAYSCDLLCFRCMAQGTPAVCDGGSC